MEFPENVCFTCSRCGLCCGDTTKKTRHILLTELDAMGIKLATNKPVRSFAKTIAGKEQYCFEMRKLPSGHCIFLVGKECAIYENRPLICRFYPFELRTNLKGGYVFRVTDECPGISAANDENSKSVDRHFFETLLQLANAHLNGGSGAHL